MSEPPNLHYDLDLITKRKRIVIATSELQLEKIKNIFGIDGVDRVKGLGNGIYELFLDSKMVLMPKILEQITLGDTRKNSKPPTIKLPDFEGSKPFYEGAGKKSYQIISDEFSNARNQELYKGFQNIEQRLRQTILLQRPKNDKLVATNDRRLPDHGIATYGLSEFFERFLYIPASEEYMRKEWSLSASKDENEVIRIAQLRKSDELGIRLSKKELGLIQKRRNACMHFRVVTGEEYQDVVPLINNYLIAEVHREMREAMEEFMSSISSSFQKSIGVMVPGIQGSVESLSRLVGELYVPPDFSAIISSLIKEIGQTGLKKAVDQKKEKD